MGGNTLGPKYLDKNYNWVKRTQEERIEMLEDIVGELLLEIQWLKEIEYNR